MGMKRSVLMGVVLCCVCAIAQAGPLTGQTLGGTDIEVNGAPSPLVPPTALVGSGVEFRVDYGATPFFSVDFTEDALVTVTQILSGRLGHGAQHSVTFFDVAGTIPDILDVSLTGTFGVTGITQSDISWTTDSFTVELGSGTSWGPGDFFTMQVTHVPEPTTLALLGFGLVGVSVAVMRRKRRSAA
jgi:hypothetical protein